MVTIANPFDAGGYSLAEMTEAINILPKTIIPSARINGDMPAF
jgi:hypothetical protein